jgi:hypothetical protein
MFITISSKNLRIFRDVRKNYYGLSDKISTFHILKSIPVIREDAVILNGVANSKLTS